MPSAVSGVVDAPSSKSVAQRAIALAAMAHGTSTLSNVGRSDDVRAAVEVARALGVRVDEGQSGELRVHGGPLKPRGPLPCGESGLALRMFAPIAATVGGPVVLTGRGSLLQRPLGPLVEALGLAGVDCRTTGGGLPLTVCGPLRPSGELRLDGSHGSQVLTGLLLALVRTGQQARLRVDKLKSRPYVDLTIGMMRRYGVGVEVLPHDEFRIAPFQRYLPSHLDVEGDWSAAAFWMVAGAIAGDVVVKRLNHSSLQPDAAIVGVLRQVGARVEVAEGSVRVQRAGDKAFTYDATHSPDLFPPLVALAANCKGISEICGVARLRHKESDRAAALMEEFGKMGIRIEIHGDTMLVHGGNPRAAALSSHGDHRMAMACAVAALRANSAVQIDGAEAVEKSYPSFWGELLRLQGEQPAAGAARITKVF